MGNVDEVIGVTTVVDDVGTVPDAMVEVVGMDVVVSVVLTIVGCVMARSVEGIVTMEVVVVSSVTVVLVGIMIVVEGITVDERMVVMVFGVGGVVGTDGGTSEVDTIRLVEVVGSQWKCG